MTNLNEVPTGTEPFKRIGRKIQIKSIHMNMLVNMHDLGGLGGEQTFYMYLVQDQQTNGVQAANTLVWTSSDPVLALVNMANSDRFRILKKWIIPKTYVGGAPSNWGSQDVPVEYYKKCNIDIDFEPTGTTGEIGEQRSNSIQLWTGCSGANDLQVKLKGAIRLRYYD